MARLIFFEIASASSMSRMRPFGGVGLAHLLAGILEAHDARRRSGNHRLGDREEIGIEPCSAIDLAKSLLNLVAMSRVSSRCCFWSSPTGTCVAL